MRLLLPRRFARNLVVAALVAAATFSLTPARAADCFGNAGGTQANCGVVNMYINGSGQSVPVTAASPLPVTLSGATSMTGITPTDRTVTSATGSSQTLMAANASRHSLLVVNTGASNCGINPTGGTAAIGGAGTLTLAPLGSYSPRIPTVSAVTAICTSGQPLYADEN